MREIQDMTFNVARGLEAVDHHLDDLRREFREWATLDRKAIPGVCTVALGVRGVPASSDLHIERVHEVREITPAVRTYRCALNGAQTYELTPVCSTTQNWRPILRGTQASDGQIGRDGRRSLLQLHCDGTVVYQLAVVATADDAQQAATLRYMVYPGWLFGLVLNAMDAADRFRAYAGAHSVEYVFELEIMADIAVPVFRMTNGDGYEVAGTLPAGPSLLPRYPVGGAESRDSTLNLMWHDFWNSIGIETKPDEFKLV